MLETRTSWEWSDGAISTFLPLMFPTPLSQWDFCCLCVKYGPSSKQIIAAMNLTWVSLWLMLINYLQIYCSPEFPQCFSMDCVCSEIRFHIILLLALNSSDIFLAGSNGSLVCLPFSFLIFARIVLVYWIFIQMKFLDAWGYRPTISWPRQSLTPAQMK